MLEAMLRTVEGTNVVLLKHIMGKRTQRTTNRTWEKPTAGEVLRVDGIHKAAT